MMSVINDMQQQVARSVVAISLSNLLSVKGFKWLNSQIQSVLIIGLGKKKE